MTKESRVIVLAPERLRELARWYPAIWDARLRTAEELEAEPLRIERPLASSV
jgi:hypothetical protein